ncbi:unnamed protein product [Rotaria socialis]
MLQSMVIHHKRPFFTRRTQLSAVILIPLCRNSMHSINERKFITRRTKTKFFFTQRLWNHLRKRIFLAAKYNFSNCANAEKTNRHNGINTSTA